MNQQASGTTAIPGRSFSLSRIGKLAPDIPFPLILLLLSLALGLFAGMDDAKFLAVFNRGFGQSMGYFAILLLCSFFLAAAIGSGEPLHLGRLGLFLSPLTGAGMVCPDTSYATLSPIAGKYRRAIAAGSYAGFKLLIPAGPMIIGISLAADVGSIRFILTGFALLVPVLVVSLVWLRLRGRGSGPGASGTEERLALTGPVLRRLFPFCGLLALLAAGFLFQFQGHPTLKFLTAPIGALLVTSLLTYGLIEPEHRRKCLDSALKRTAPLLLVIAVATALGTLVASMVPLGRLAMGLTPGRSNLVLALILFGVTALFKMLNGSSMATFAAVPPILAPVVAASSLDPTLAVYAICLGSFVAILPNDSFFWLTQPEASSASSKPGPDFTFTVLSVIQGVTGLAALFGYLLLTGRS